MSKYKYNAIVFIGVIFLSVILAYFDEPWIMAWFLLLAMD